MIQEIKSAIEHIKAYSSDNIFRDIFCETMYKITKNPYWLNKMGWITEEDA